MIRVIEMMNKILVISPYRAEILKAVINALVIKLVDVVIVGSKNKIIELCYLNDINYRLLNIIDASYELDICFKANEIIGSEPIKGVLFGDFPKSYQKNIVKVDYEISIVDTPSSSQLLFVSNYIRDEFVGFEEKKDAILAGKDFMRNLSINHCNIGLVSGDASRTLKIEKNVIKMDKDLINDNIEIININQIFEEGYNLLVFNDLNSSRIFVDTVLMNEKSKYASIKKASKQYVIDAHNMKLKDIFFSIFLLNKITLDTEAC
jgi:hypothetical protein